MSRDESRYQKLRSHLHYLRLEAAAEALPGELERARTEKLSHTAFLERLLALEVEATEARRSPNSGGHLVAWCDALVLDVDD